MTHVRLHVHKPMPTVRPRRPCPANADSQHAFPPVPAAQFAGADLSGAQFEVGRRVAGKGRDGAPHCRLQPPLIIPPGRLPAPPFPGAKPAGWQGVCICLGAFGPEDVAGAWTRLFSQAAPVVAEHRRPLMHTWHACRPWPCRHAGSPRKECRHVGVARCASAPAPSPLSPVACSPSPRCRRGTHTHPIRGRCASVRRRRTRS